MYIKELKLYCFKNYDEKNFNFSSKINCIIGLNGSGKTNILDAIHYLCLCKSFFNHSDINSIKYGEKEFAIHGIFQEENDILKLSCSYKREGRKKIKLNQTEYDKLSDHIGLLPIIMISPWDNFLITEGSEVRRKYIDSIICQYDRTYLHHLIVYQKILQQRNTLLKQYIETGDCNNSILSIYDKQLIEPCNAIYLSRKYFIEKITPIFNKYYFQLSAGKEDIQLIYQSQLNDKIFKDELENNLATDKRTGYTGIGIHKDDYVFQMDHHLIKRFGSQGQQKTFVISLKLAQFEILKFEKKCKPILLLDDIFDKLDDLRFLELIKTVSQSDFGQILITDTDENRIKKALKKINCIGHFINI